MMVGIETEAVALPAVPEGRREARLPAADDSAAETVVLLIEKVTFPVGITPPTDGTVAVSVMGWVVVAGLGVTERPTEEACLLGPLTVTVIGVEEAELKVASPP